MSKFKQGQSGNPKGRKVGSKNRSTVRKALLKLLDNNLDKLQTDIDNLKGKDRANFLLGLAKHCTPAAINPEKLSTEQLQQILQYLRDNEEI